MAIPYGHQSINDDDIASVVEVLRSDWLTMGPTNAAFEAALAAVAQTTDALVVTSGTAALHCAYVAAGIGPGDEVVTTPMTFVATAATAAHEGATIKFADIDEVTRNIDPSAVEAAMSERTKVVAAVDYAGHPADLDDLLEIAHRAGALLLEDAAHSIGSVYRGRPVGGIADMTEFSFFPTKNMTTGEGGAFLSTDPDLIDRVRRFRGQGMIRERARLRHPDEGGWHQEVQSFGINYRLPDILGALGLSQLSRLQAFKARRTALYDRYNAALSDLDGVVLPAKRDDVDPMWHLYPIRVRDGQRKRVYDYMRQNGILVQVNYIPVYWHPVFEDLGYRRGMCPVAESFYEEELSLPMHVELSDADQDRVIEVLQGALK
jgi:dTDP-4-amino-4,6-dideoxygalactose transaminase